MKLNPRVTELALYDIRGGPGPFARQISTVHQSSDHFLMKQVLLLISAISTQRAQSEVTTQHRPDSKKL
jgi:hypothetical protein